MVRFFGGLTACPDADQGGSAACEGASVPPSTALRGLWGEAEGGEGLFALDEHFDFLN